MFFAQKKRMRGFYAARCVSMALGITFLFSCPAFAQGYGRFVSNTPIPAGPNASLEEVWVKHGGARLQFDALMGPIQVNTNGRPWRDPVLVDYLPPLHPKKRGARSPAPTVREPKKTEQMAPSASKTAPNPSPRPAIAPQPVAPTVNTVPLVQNSENISGSGSLGESPYTGTAPTAPDAPGDVSSASDSANSQIPPKENQDPFHYH